MAMLTQLWNDWEIQLLVLLSFTLQVIVFFGGGLRRRSRNSARRLLIWLVYLLADFVAVYALGQLSRHESDAPGVAVGQMHQLVFFWIPFLIHLGGQDTITAFSIEDNELWLRHLLNLLVQVCPALYVFWKSAAHNQFLVPAIFAFVAGIIKYGERTWALRCASQKSLSGSTNGEAVRFPELEDEQELDYLTTAKFALSSAPGVRNLFVGRKLEQMDGSVESAFTGGFFYEHVSEDGQLVFKILEMEVGMMYDSLYTKAPVIRTWAGAILRCFTHISLVIAFVLFLIRNKQWHYSRVDVAITYTLFIGAFCLEVCAIFFTVVMSPYTWAFFQSRKLHRLARAAWSIFKSVRPESKPWWSNSMGQYNFLSSCFSDKVVGKVMDLVGAKELWRNFRHAKHVDFRTDTKKLIFESKCLAEIFRQAPYQVPTLGANPTSGVGGALDMMYCGIPSRRSSSRYMSTQGFF